MKWGSMYYQLWNFSCASQSGGPCIYRKKLSLKLQAVNSTIPHAPLQLQVPVFIKIPLKLQAVNCIIPHVPLKVEVHVFYQQNNQCDLHLKPQAVNFIILHIPLKVEVYVFYQQNNHEDLYLKPQAVKSNASFLTTGLLYLNKINQLINYWLRLSIILVHQGVFISIPMKEFDLHYIPTYFNDSIQRLKS
jgi:hypothetical protein